MANFRLPILASFPFFPDLCQRLAAVAQRLLASTAGPFVYLYVHVNNRSTSMYA